jgi:hypothetical protein
LRRNLRMGRWADERQHQYERSDDRRVVHRILPKDPEFRQPVALRKTDAGAQWE